MCRELAGHLAALELPTEMAFCPTSGGASVTAKTGKLP